MHEMAISLTFRGLLLAVWTDRRSLLRANKLRTAKYAPFSWDTIMYLNGYAKFESRNPVMRWFVV
jgi:hypothetical protein